jgi:DNA-binding transcriptional ArsR family regulator
VAAEDTPLPTIDVTDAKRIRAIAHPIRQRVLAVIGDRPATSAELATTVGVSPATIRYHLRALVETGLVEPVDLRTPGRIGRQGYRRRGVPNIPEGVWTELPEELRRLVVSTLLIQVDTEIRLAASAGGFLQPGSRLHRSALTLDQQARAELAGDLDALARRARELEALSKRRLAASGRPAPIATLAVLMLFERSAGSGNG